MNFAPLSPHASPAELGASLVPGGVHFALAAPEATAVELCLYDPEGRHETARLALSADTRDATGGVWHALLPCSEPQATGLVYGWRVLINTDQGLYGGSDHPVDPGPVEAVPMHHRAQSIRLNLPPLACIVLAPSA